jgi:hypothetical protein
MATTPQGLSPERFDALIEAVRTRRSDTEAARALVLDDDVRRAWQGYLSAVDRDVMDLNRALEYAAPEDYGTRVFSRSLRGRYSRFVPEPGSNGALRTPELAIVLGELSRLAELSPSELAVETLGTISVVPTVRTNLGEAAHLGSTYPLLASMSDILIRQSRPVLKEADAGLGAPRILRAMHDLRTIQDRLGLKSSTLVRRNLGSLAATLGRALAGRTLLAASDLPEAFEAAYEGHWHTEAKTREPGGAFIEEARERARTSGSPELLITLAASSDGRNRQVAGASERTPEAVYDKLIYDNSLAVLMRVVESRHFTQYKAAAMIDTGLAKQITAVMLNSHARTRNGRIDLQIRYTACERAIAHPEVSPLHVYQFLGAHSRHEDFPTFLWPDFIKELSHRYAAAKLRGAEKEQKYYQDCVERFTTQFMEQDLKPYWEAGKKVRQGELSKSAWAQHHAREGAAYLGAHEHVKDPALLAILVHGCTSAERLVDLLRYTKESNLPITNELMVKVFTSPDHKVREAGLSMLPNIRPQDIEAAQAAMDERVAEDRERLRERVFNAVIPDYEPIDGEPRRLSRMRHFFLAARELAARDLEEIYIRCAEQDPRAIPERFREITEMRRSQQRMLSQVSDAELAETSAHFAVPVEQANLLDVLAAPAAPASPAAATLRGAAPTTQNTPAAPAPPSAEAQDFLPGFAPAPRSGRVGVSNTVRSLSRSR